MTQAEGEAAAARARAEAECRAAKERADARVVPLAEAMTRAEGEAAAARASKETHALAIKHGVMPKVMERVPPRLKLEGGSLTGRAAEYVGFYLFDGKFVNGRPAWKHTNGSCWIAFDGVWMGQPEADLGQKRGVLMLTDAAAASPDASSATWQASTGTAWAAQPALTCTVATAAEVSDAQAAAELRAEEAQAAAVRAQTSAQSAAARARFSQFQGPCKECCIPLAYCCVSSDGAEVYGCVPTEYDYMLPLCLHTCLCPQQGCNPCPAHNGVTRDGWKEEALKSLCLPTLCLACVREDKHSCCCSWEHICCWEITCTYLFCGCLCFVALIVCLVITLPIMCSQGRAQGYICVTSV